MKTQLDPSSCIGIKAFADLHNCTELFSSSMAYITKDFLYDKPILFYFLFPLINCKNYDNIFREIAECKERLSLSFEEVAKLIS